MAATAADKRLGKRLREVVQKSGLTLDEFSDKLFYTRKYIYGITLGTNPMTRAVASSVSEKFGADYEWLMGVAENEQG